MGFITEQNRTSFWRPAGGFLWHTCKEGDEGAEPYVPTKGEKAGVTSYRQKAFGYSGMLTSVQIKGGKFGLTLNIGFDDKIVISVNAKGSYLLSFAQIIRGIDLSKPLTCVPWMFTSEKDGRDIVGWSWKQNGVKLVKHPELDHQNEECILPEPEEVMLANGKPLLKDGKKVLNWEPRENWIIDYINDWAIENLLALDERGNRIAPPQGGAKLDSEPDLNGGQPEEDEVPL